jgi:putative membrane protein
MIKHIVSSKSAAIALLLAVIAVSSQVSARRQAISGADRAFVAKVSQGCMFEVAAGKLAMQRGSTQDIRDLGTSEQHDHVLVGNRLSTIAKHLSIAHERKLNAMFQEDLETLESLNGHEFDMAFVRAMDDIHNKDGAAFAQEADKGRNADLRAFAQETHRIIDRHLGALNAIAP